MRLNLSSSSFPPLHLSFSPGSFLSPGISGNAYLQSLLRIMRLPRAAGFTFALWITTFVHLSSVASAAKPYPLLWNTSHEFGYDGPWHAIPMKIGWPEQTINLYPGGTWSSVVLGSHIEDSTGAEYPNQKWLQSSEVWDASTSEPTRKDSTENFDIAQANRGGVTGSIDGTWRASAAMNMTGSGVQLTDRMTFASPDNGVTIPNVSLSAVYEANIGFPDGRTVPLDMGFLSLGARAPQSWDSYVGNVFSEYLASKKSIPSNSWSLHIGSATMGIPGSLILGGYDTTRAIGEVGMYDTTDGFGGMFADLVDIQLGLAGNGGSPWPFRSKTNMLRNANNKTQSISVRPNPTAPYLFLPNNTCETIAGYLPVTWRWDLGLYTWNTDDPKYEEVINSPSYLKFIFQRPAGRLDIEIKVPFALLNLTLKSPIVDTPTQYFPCRPFDSDGSEYHLGRAFLQAAFLGMNWGTSKWWLAQAPGPGSLTSSIASITNGTKSLTTSAPSDFWEESWKQALNDLPNPQSSGSSNKNEERNHSLSGGAIAGAAVGASVGGLSLLGLAFFFWRRKRANRRAEDQAESQRWEAQAKEVSTHPPPIMQCAYGPAELGAEPDVHEIMTTSQPPQELMTTEDYPK